MLLGPVLVVVGCFVLLVVGLWQDNDVVAGIGAGGVVIGLALPLLTKAELGGGKVGASFASDFRDIAFEAYREALAQGAPPEKAAEIAEDSVPLEKGFVSPRYLLLGPPGSGRTHALAAAQLLVWQALSLERQVDGILRSLADELGWEIEAEVQSPLGTLDFVVNTGTERIAIEVSSGDEVRSADRLRRAAGHLEITLGAVVVADGPAGVYGARAVPPVNQFPAIIEVQDLSAWLRAVASQ
jgi:hypothetical protein